MISDIYTYDDYREYLNFALSQEGQGRGARQRLANFLGCQPSFISQVLKGKNDISLEHAFKINNFLEHNSDESDYFMVLVQIEKSGTVELSDYYKKHLEKIRIENLQIEKIVKKKELNHEEILLYWTNFICISIHILVSIPKYRPKEKMFEKLKVSEEEFERALEFLKESGLVKEKNGELSTGEAHIHLSKGSPYAQAASILTRLKVLEKIRLSDPNTINYSSNFTMSKSSYIELKKQIIDFTGHTDELIKKGRPDKFCTVVLDLIEH